MSSVARVTEITARSDESFEDAIKIGLARAAKTLRRIEGIWVKEQKVDVRNGEVATWQVDMLVTFMLDDQDDSDEETRPPHPAGLA
jgi:dodecin